jgi:protocatechuate 3,4-dioxygenase beta subunit
MSTVTFNPVSYGVLSFTNISATETDIGSTIPFTSAAGVAAAVNTLNGPAIAWGGFSSGAYYANSSQVLNFNYTVSSTSSTELIDTVGQLYTADYFGGPGVHLVAVENDYDTSGNLVGTETFIQGQTNPAAVLLTTPEQTINVQVTLTLSVDSTGNSSSGVFVSVIQQSFGTVAAPPATASIGDIVFYDATASGLETGFDSGPGIPNVTVELLNGTGTSVLETTTTDSQGHYSLTSLQAGVYEVEFISPTGYHFSPQGVGTNSGINSSPNAATGITGPITLTAGQADHYVEAGLVPGGSGAGASATIGNTVWLDTNADGLDDNSESGLAGVTVELLNAAGTSVLATTTTNASGNYQFTNLNAGTYEVQFLAPAGDAFTTQGVATATGINSSANSAGLSGPITLTSGQIDNAVNAGLKVLPASISSTVWIDTNKDGLLDNGESGQPGVTVELLNAAGTSVLATTTTNASGNYTFSNLAPDNYDVEVVPPTGYGFTTQGATGAIDSAVNATSGITAPFTLTAGQTDTALNAGLVAQPAAITGEIWFDANRDGLLDNGETGASGVSVGLWNANGTSMITAVATQANGTYTFANLAPGTYEVSVVPLSGYALTTKASPAAPMPTRSSIRQRS